jgi:hypothetical protein
MFPLLVIKSTVQILHYRVQFASYFVKYTLLRKMRPVWNMFYVTKTRFLCDMYTSTQPSCMKCGLYWPEVQMSHVLHQWSPWICFSHETRGWKQPNVLPNMRLPHMQSAQNAYKCRMFVFIHTTCRPELECSNSFLLTGWQIWMGWNGWSERQRYRQTDRLTDR